MIHLIMGPMFSGKTTELLRRLNRAQIAGKKVILLRPAIDIRPGLTHDDIKDNVAQQANISSAKFDIPQVFLKKLDNFDINGYDVIGVDEGQFFKDLSSYANKYANSEREVIVSGLDATSEQTPFEEILNLIPFCEEVVKLSAICSVCGSEYASFTFFKGGRKKDKIVVGGIDLYEARCRKCLEKD